MKFNGKTILRLIVILLIFFAYNLTSSLSDPIVKSESGLPASIFKNEKVEIKCGSGFSKIPDELKDLFQKQLDSYEDVSPLSNKSITLKNEMDFYGYTYSVYGSFSENIRSECSAQEIKREKITFVGKEINEIIRMYMSAVIFNETTTFKAQSNAVENNPKLSEVSKLRLCMNSQCGMNDNNGEYKIFDYLNLADIKYARTFADSFLFINTMDRLKVVIDNSVGTSKLTDSELTQIITSARTMSYIKADEMNK